MKKNIKKILAISAVFFMTMLVFAEAVVAGDQIMTTIGSITHIHELSDKVDIGIDVDLDGEFDTEIRFDIGDDPGQMSGATIDHLKQYEGNTNVGLILRWIPGSPNIYIRATILPWSILRSLFQKRAIDNLNEDENL